MANDNRNRSKKHRQWTAVLAIIAFSLIRNASAEAISMSLENDRLFTERPLPSQGTVTSAVYEINLAGMDLTELPGDLDEYREIRVIHLGCNERMTALPSYMGALIKMEELDINNGNGCSMRLHIRERDALPKNLRRLNLAGALAEGSRLDTASLKWLEFLDISRLKSPQFPESILKLEYLKDLRMNYMSLESLPAQFGQLKNLESLYLNGNAISAKSWPDLSRHPSLKLVELGNNSLTKLEQTLIRSRLPKTATVVFENLWDDSRANED
jgi:Leucine-rich repeat (LRR) protein